MIVKINLIIKKYEDNAWMIKTNVPVCTTDIRLYYGRFTVYPPYDDGEDTWNESDLVSQI